MRADAFGGLQNMGIAAIHAAARATIPSSVNTHQKKEVDAEALYVLRMHIQG